MKTLPNLHPGEVLLEEFPTLPGQPERSGACRRRAAAFGTSERSGFAWRPTTAWTGMACAVGAQARKIARIAA